MTETLILGFEWYIVFLFSTVCHEAAHALVAMKLGDRTAYYWGQVSLDPIPHIRREPFGTVIVPILSYLWSSMRSASGGWMIGWASAPYDPFWALRYPRRAALMALAGPVSNFLLLLVAALIIRVGLYLEFFDAPQSPTYTQTVVANSRGIAGGVAVLVSILFTLNLLLFTFNLLPLPPLDGSAVLQLFMPRETAERYQEFLRTPALSIIGLLVAWRLFALGFGHVRLFALNLLFFGTGHYYVLS